LRYLVAAAVAALSLVVAAPASADYRQGASNDAVGDAPSGPLDIEQVRGSYDQGGSIRVTVRFAAPGTSADHALVSANFIPDPTGNCAPGSPHAALSDDNDPASQGAGTYVWDTQNGSFNGARSFSTDHREMTMEYTDSVRLGGFDFRCVAVTIWNGAAIVDSHYVYFGGYEPDRDGDRRPDAIDACPDEAGSTPDGCPAVITAAPASPTTTFARSAPRAVLSIARAKTATSAALKKRYGRVWTNARAKRTNCARAGTKVNCVVSFRHRRSRYSGRVMVTSSAGRTKTTISIRKR
jgi:hypothetical protein